jgi:2,3-diaminopropionate biosynthesis protein SbnB
MRREDDDVLILGRAAVAQALAGQERRLVELVREAYLAHARGHSALPPSVFLRFPQSPRDRIIALPAYLGGNGTGHGVAGMKWISSFPDNLSRGLERASAVIVVNSMETGRPLAVLEGALISAQRTAASAALAAQCLHTGPAPVVGLVGAGRINLEIMRFLSRLRPEVEAWLVHDLDRARGEELAARGREAGGAPRVEVVETLGPVLERSSLVSFATTAVEPHVRDLSACPPGTTVLHVSLRDLAPEAILSSDNVVDDVEHVCRAQTSVHLAEQQTGHRRFIRCELAAVLEASAPPRQAPGPTVFSPFGLGVLDLAVARHVLEVATREGLGTLVEGFLG